MLMYIYRQQLNRLDFMFPQNNPQVPVDPTGKITVTLPSGKIAEAITRLVVNKKPLGWSRRSYSTYYKEPYGLWMKKILDRLSETKKAVYVKYADFPSLSTNSVYLMVNQSILFVLQNLDPLGVYAKLRHEIKIRKMTGVGIVFEFDVLLSDLPEAIDVVPTKDKPKWKKRIDEYLEDGKYDGQPLHIDNVVLSNEEVEQQKLELSGLSNVMFSITNNEIKIIKGC